MKYLIQVLIILTLYSCWPDRTDINSNTDSIDNANQLANKGLKKEKLIFLYGFNDSIPIYSDTIDFEKAGIISWGDTLIVDKISINRNFYPISINGWYKIRIKHFNGWVHQEQVIPAMRVIKGDSYKALIEINTGDGMFRGENGVIVDLSKKLICNLGSTNFFFTSPVWSEDEKFFIYYDNPEIKIFDRLKDTVEIIDTALHFEYFENDNKILYLKENPSRDTYLISKKLNSLSLSDTIYKLNYDIAIAGIEESEYPFYGLDFTIWKNTECYTFCITRLDTVKSAFRRIYVDLEGELIGEEKIN